MTSVLQNVTCFVGPTFHLFDKASSFFTSCLPTDFQPVSEDGSGGHGGSTWPLMGLTQLSTAALATGQTFGKEIASFPNDGVVSTSACACVWTGAGGGEETNL